MTARDGFRDGGYVSRPGTGIEFGRPWVEQQLARFTYKPNWTFRHLQHPIGRPLLDDMGDYVLIQMEVEDSTGRREPVHPYRLKATPNPDPYGEPTIEVATQPVMVKVGGRWLVDPGIVANRDEQQFARWLLDAIRQAEDHEMREWFRRDGELWDDPHKWEKQETGR